MKSKKSILMCVLCVGALLLSGVAASAQTQPPAKMIQLGIPAVKAVKSVRAAAEKASQAELLDRFIESLDQQLIDAFHNTRKFSVIAGGDLNEIIKSWAPTGNGIWDPSDPKAPLPGKVKGTDYLLVATVDDFVNSSSGTHVEGMGLVVSRRYARVSVVLKLYNSTTGQMLQSAVVPVTREEKGTARVTNGDFNNTPQARSDSILVMTAGEVAQRSAQRIVDVLFPAKVIAVGDSVITISRGEGAGIARDEVWEVFALGAEMKDPDTGESLGRQEEKIGEVVITDVLPKFSKARLIGDNRGIDIGNIVRLKLAPPAEAMPAAPNGVQR